MDLNLNGKKIYYVGIWPRRIWDVCTRTNYRRDVRAGDDFTRKLFSLKERLIAQYCQRAHLSPLFPARSLPDVRNAVLEVIERDPLIFSKSLAVQVKSLIVTPLQPLTKAGFFNGRTFRRLVIIDVLMNALTPRFSETYWKF